MGRLLLAMCLLASCGGDDDDVNEGCPVAAGLDDAYTIAADGIEVEIRRAPYGISVRDGDGQELVRSADGGGGDGYAAVAHAEGLVSYDRVLTPGYLLFYATLEPYRDGFELAGVTVEAERLTARLRDTGDPTAPCVQVAHEVRASALRVTASYDGDTPRAWAAGFETPASEGFLGFGERFNRTNQRGRDVYAWAEEGGLGTGEGELAGPDNPQPNGELMTYYPVPFFVSTERYGFWLDSSWRNEFNLATERADAWKVWHVGPELAYEIYVPVADDARPWPYHLIDRFTEATGRPMLPPAWTFGPRRRIGRGSTVDGVAEVQAMRVEDLAITAVDDAVHFYPSGSHLGREAELAAWIDSAEALGYRVNGYYNSMVDQRDDRPLADHAAEGVANDYFLRNADGSFPDVWILTGGDVPPLYVVDFTNPDAAAWYGASFDWALDLGYAGWMYDFGEYVLAEVLAHDGMTGEELHNLYPTLYARTAYETLEAGPAAGDWLAFMRSGYTGSSAFVPMVWSGDPAASFEDSDGLPSMVRAGVNLGISGAPHWGGDIGGFHCQADGALAADEELLTRWIQQGAMGSNMMDQNACVGGSSAAKASIWKAPAAKEAWRAYARLHTRLFPYLYTLAHEATATGAPVMRHVFLEHPERPELADVDDAYYVGRALFVAPVVTRGATSVTVDLPAELYLDWREQQLVAGGDGVGIDAPLDKLPLLLRAGELVPMLDASIDTLADEDSADVVGPADVAGMYDVVGLLVDDSTASFAVYDGTELTAARAGAFAAPALPEAADEAELATCASCYRVDDLGGGLQRVRITAPAGTVTAGGLQLTSTGARTIRWDLYLAP